MAPETGGTSPLTAVERALRSSLLVSEFRDVHLYAFSRRTILPDRTLRINHPVPVVAISSILKNTESFANLLAAPDAIRQQANSSEYDYESDSDLDEFEEPRVEDSDVFSAAGPGPSSSGGLFSASEGKLQDRSMDLEAGQDAMKDSTIATTKHYLEVPVSNVAHQTLHACVFYLYTGKINFTPLTSRGLAKKQVTIFTASNDLAPPACSPKSIYRLAELYGLIELRDLAYNEIVSQLSPQNILEEAFSSLFARYDRLRGHAVSYLSQNYSTPAVQQSLPDIIQRIASGGMPHARGVLRSLLGLRIATLPQPRGHHISHPRAFRPTLPTGRESLSRSPFARQILASSVTSLFGFDPLQHPPESSLAATSPHVPSSSIGIDSSFTLGDVSAVNEEAPRVSGGKKKKGKKK